MRQLLLSLALLLGFCQPLLAEAGAEKKPSKGLSDIQYSPDKTFFIARMGSGSKNDQILVVDAKAKNAITELAKPRDAVIDWYRWVDNDRVVYQILLQSEKAEAINGLTMVYAMDKDGGNRKQIFGLGLERHKRDTRINVRKEIKAQLEIADVLADDKKTVLVLEYPLKKVGSNNYVRAEERPVTLSRLDVYSGKRKKVQKLSYAEAKKYGS